MEERRRFAYCVLGALALHAAGVLAQRSRRSERAVVQVTPPKPPKPREPSEVPVSFEDAPQTPQALRPPPPPPAEPPPAPRPVATSREAADTLQPIPVEKPRKPVTVRATPRPTAHEPPPKALPDSKPADDAAAFGGKRGAFRAQVCFLPEAAKSALLVDGCQAVASFRTNEINVSPRRFKRGFPGVEQRVEWFGIDYQGRFKVRVSGYYTFRLLSDDGAVLFIDGEKVVDNDGQHASRSAKMALPLSAGEHEFRLLYYQGPGYQLSLQLFVKGYQTPEQLFGPEF